MLSTSFDTVKFASLQSKKNLAEFADEVIQDSDKFNGFNLILADLCSKNMVYMTNRPKEKKPSVLQVSLGIHVLTNANLDSPWPKVCFLPVMLNWCCSQCSSLEKKSFCFRF